MNTQSEATQGQMVEFRATRDFGMGGMNIQKGMTITYDGYNVSVGGRQQALPAFRGAIKIGWAVPAEQFDPSAVAAAPQSAGIKVRPADTGNPMNRQAAAMITVVDAEERIVGDYKAHAKEVRESNQSRRNITAATGTSIEPQDGVVVRTLSPLNSKHGERTTLTGSNTQQLINKANDVQIQPGRGVTREEVMARMTPEQREQYQAEILIRKSAHVDLQRSDVQGGETSLGKIVGRVAQPGVSDSEGFRTTTTVGGGTETVDLSGLDSKPVPPEVIEVEGMKFTVTAPRKAVHASAPAVWDHVDPRRVIAKAICSDFPDLYDFEASTRKKIARIQADFEDRPDVIRAIAAAETDADMKVRIVEEFPEAFGQSS